MNYSNEELDTLRRHALTALSHITKGRNWADWKTVGAYIETGRLHAMHMSNSNAPIGIRYNGELNEWFDLNPKFRDGIGKDERNDLMRCLENMPAIETFLSQQGPQRSRQLNHPTSILRAWKRDETRKEREAELAKAAKYAEEAVKADDGTPLNTPVINPSPTAGGVLPDEERITLQPDEAAPWNAMRIKKGFSTEAAKELTIMLIRLTGMTMEEVDEAFESSLRRTA